MTISVRVKKTTKETKENLGSCNCMISCIIIDDPFTMGLGENAVRLKRSLVIGKCKFHKLERDQPLFLINSKTLSWEIQTRVRFLPQMPGLELGIRRRGRE
jgi:hypothetical protein